MKKHMFAGNKYSSKSNHGDDKAYKKLKGIKLTNQKHQKVQLAKAYSPNCHKSLSITFNKSKEREAYY